MMQLESIRSGLRGTLVVAGIGIPLALAACEVRQEREGDMPDVDVSARGGQLPAYDVEKTREGHLPDVDVDVEGGRLPAYDIDAPDIDVGTTEKTVKVPKVRVVVEEEEIEVPYIDVDLHGDDADADAERDLELSDAKTPREVAKSDQPTAAGVHSLPPAAGSSATDQTVTVRVDAPEARYDLNIEEVYLDEDDGLLVISRLEKQVPASGETPDASTRDVSDTVVVRAPDLAVNHIIIGEDVGDTSDPSYRFVGARSEIEGELRTARLLYRESTRVMDPANTVSQR